VTSEREILRPVLECTASGALDRDAVGWSRRPLHTCNVRGRWPRKKRWDYWGVTTREHFLAVTIADIDYAGLAVVTFLDYRTRVIVERAAVVPFARGFAMPDTVRGGAIEIDAMGLAVSIHEEPATTCLRASFAKRGVGDVRVDVAIERPPDHESVSVLVPWSEREFQYTSKHVALRARGEVRVGARAYAFGPDNDAFACLDFGRGVWPRRCAWNWAAASGVEDGRVVGINLGGKWTDGTGTTENGVCVDGRVHKIGDSVAFDYDRNDFTRPWRVTGPNVELDYAPFFDRTVKLSLGVLSTELHWTLGRFRGAIVSGDGERIAIRDLLGWAEEHRARW
jgi:hypothetical protein